MERLVPKTLFGVSVFSALGTTRSTHVHEGVTSRIESDISVDERKLAVQKLRRFICGGVHVGLPGRKESAELEQSFPMMKT